VIKSLIKDTWQGTLSELRHTHSHWGRTSCGEPLEAIALSRGNWLMTALFGHSSCANDERLPLLCATVHLHHHTDEEENSNY
jgi:hypothetical protein